MSAGDWFDLSDPESVYEGKPIPLVEPPWLGRAIRLGWALVATLAARALIDGARLVLAVAGVLG